MKFVYVAAAAVLLAGPCLAQDVAPPPAEAVAVPVGRPAPTAVTGTPIVIELTEALSSRTSVRGQAFALRLAEPITVDGVVLAPAGTPGVGEVVFAAPKGWAGKPGELTLAARYLTLDGRRVPLRGLKLTGSGYDAGAALVWSVAVGAPPTATASEVEYPAGTRAVAKLGADLVAPAS